MSNKYKNAIALFFTSFALVLTCIFTFVPLKVKAFTGTIHMTCANFTQGYGTHSCTGDVFTLGSGGGIYENGNPAMYQVNGQTIYVSYIATGSGDINLSESGGDGEVFLTGSQSNYPFTPSNGHTTISPVLSSDGGATFTGTISNLCMSVDPTGCDSSPSGQSVDIFGYVFSGNVPLSSSTASIINNPNQDMFNVFVIFIMSAFATYSVFSKRR